jgi:hypothetical protein
MMGAASKLKHEKLKGSKSKKPPKPAIVDYLKKVAVKVAECLPAFLFFRSPRRGFHYCKGPRRTGNSWWINSGRENAYRRYGSVVSKIKNIAAITATAIARPFRSKKLMIEEPLKLEKVEHAKEKTEKIIHNVIEKTESRPMVVKEKPESRNEIPVDSFPVKPAAKLHFSHIEPVETKKMKMETAPSGTEKAQWINGEEIKANGIRVKNIKTPETRTEKIKNEAAFGETRVRVPELATAGNPEKHLAAVHKEEIKVPASEHRTNVSSVEIKTDKPVPVPKIEYSDVAVRARPFAFLAASVKALEDKRPGIIKTIEFKALEISMPKPDRRKSGEEDVYPVLKGIKQQRIRIQKVAAAADSLS